MKLMKKTLAILITMAIVFALCSTFAFAETTTQLTTIPAAPVVSQMYVRMQNEGGVDSGAVSALNGSGVAINQNAGWSNPINYSRGIGVMGISNAVAVNRAGTPTAFYPASKIDADLATNPQYGRYIAFESLTEEGAVATVSSGYLMLHNKAVTVSTPASDTTTAAGFGFNLYSNLTNGYYSTVSVNTGTTGMELKVQYYGGTCLTLDLSDYIAPGDTFDFKVLHNLDANTLDVYINNRPVLLSYKICNFSPKTLVIQMRGDSSSCKFGTTECYEVNEAYVSQYKQAAVERAFNRSFTANDAKPILFYTLGGGANTRTKDFEMFINVDDSYHSLSCTGVGNFKIQNETVTGSYQKIYFSGNNMTAYDYDNLKYVYVSKPKADVTSGTVSGTYMLAGGEGMNCAPVVINALYSNDEKKQLVRAVCADGSNGKYECTLSIEESDPAGAQPTAFVWGGRTKLVPLFEQIDFATLE